MALPLLVAGKDNKLDLVPGAEEDAARMTGLPVHRSVEAAASASPRGAPESHAGSVRLHQTFPTKPQRAQRSAGSLSRLSLRSDPSWSPLIFLVLTGSGSRLQHPVASADFPPSQRRPSPSNIHAVTHFINGGGFFSAHLRFFSRRRHPRNGSCCRGCMTNVLIDHSFTGAPPRPATTSRAGRV